MSEQEKYITLSDLSNSIFDSIKYIFISSIIIFFMTLYLAISEKDSWVAKLEISEINEMQYFAYNDFFPFKEIFPIDQKYLKKLFFDEVQDLKEVREVIKNLNLLSKEDFKDDIDYTKAVRGKSKNFASMYIDSLSENEKNTSFIQFQSSTYDELEKVMKNILVETNLSVQRFLVNKFQSTLQNYKINNVYKIEDINSQIENIKLNYNMEIKADLAFLKEQANIAKAIGIRDNMLQNELMITHGLPEEIELAQPYYLRGYIAIEKEIALKEKRSDINLHIRDIPSLFSEKRKIETDLTIPRLNYAYNNSPISSDEFISINYDLANISIDKVDRSNLFYLILMIITILFISLLIILFNLSKRYFQSS